MENLENNDRELKSDVSRTEDSLIKMVFFFTTAFFAILFISLYMFFGQEIVQAYVSTPELTIVSIVVLIRIGVMFTFCYIMFKKWFAQEKRYLKNIPFLVGSFFYLSAMGKFLDLLLYIYNSSPYYTEEYFLYLIKIRMFLLLLTFIPILYLGLRPVIYSWLMKKGKSDNVVLKVRRWIVVAYCCIFVVLIILISSIFFSYVIMFLMSVITYIFILYVFIFAHKHNTFPTIKSNIIALGFFIYIISSASRAIMTVLFSTTLSTGQITIIADILDFIAIFTIFLGFTLKPK